MWNDDQIINKPIDYLKLLKQSALSNTSQSNLKHINDELERTIELTKKKSKK